MVGEEGVSSGVGGGRKGGMGGVGTKVSRGGVMIRGAAGGMVGVGLEEMHDGQW